MMTDSRIVDRIEALEAAVAALMQRSAIRAGDVVLLGDGLGERWASCLGLVDEVKPWGLKVWVTGPERAAYPLRVEVGHVAKVFRAFEYRRPGHPGSDENSL